MIIRIFAAASYRQQNTLHKQFMSSINNIDMRLSEIGLIDILRLDPTIRTDIRYATTNNFTGTILYDEPFGIYAEPEIAKRIAKANKELSRIMPGHTLIIFDAARPLSTQLKMYEYVKGSDLERYIAKPDGEHIGGFHNYGMAVDLSICNNDGKLLDMGTDFDSFSSTAHVGNELQLLKEGKISQDAYNNRMLLYWLMGSQALLPYPYEWWHYQYYDKESDKTMFQLIDF